MIPTNFCRYGGATESAFWGFGSQTKWVIFTRCVSFTGPLLAILILLQIDWSNDSSNETAHSSLLWSEIPRKSISYSFIAILFMPINKIAINELIWSWFNLNWESFWNVCVSPSTTMLHFPEFIFTELAKNHAIIIVCLTLSGIT